MMLIIKLKESGFYTPRHAKDLPLFAHCCARSIVSDLSEFLPVFTSHGIQIMIEDETYEAEKISNVV